jgi:Ni/Co efflux regulator RcnB
LIKILNFANKTLVKLHLVRLALIFVGIWSTSTAFADKPHWVDDKKKGESHRQEAKSERHNNNRDSDRGKSHRQEAKSEKHNNNRDSDRGKSHKKNKSGDHRNRYFNEEKQMFIHEYYSNKFRKGRCPPGLVKKGKRCIPRGHAKKWRKGRQLPREVIFYNLPQRVLVQLGPPPPKHRFVRVAQDILLISIGTGMVVDAFEDIGRQLN